MIPENNNNNYNNKKNTDTLDLKIRRQETCKDFQTLKEVKKCGPSNHQDNNNDKAMKRENKKNKYIDSTDFRLRRQKISKDPKNLKETKNWRQGQIKEC